MAEYRKSMVIRILRWLQFRIDSMLESRLHKEWLESAKHKSSCDASCSGCGYICSGCGRP